MSIEFPRTHLVHLKDVANRVLDARKFGTDGATLARDMLIGFYDVCIRTGHDRVLVQLGEASPPVDLDDRLTLAENPTLQDALATKIGPNVDDGGPRNARPQALVDALVGALKLELTDTPIAPIAASDEARIELLAAMRAALEPGMTAATLRENIISSALALCEEKYVGAFNKITAQLDDRGMRVLKQPKVPIDAVQAVERVLTDARRTILDGVSSIAIDAAKSVLERLAPEAAARVDAPITHQLTPRAAAVRRANEVRVGMTAESVALSLLTSLTELLVLEWQAPDRPVRPYGASQTFAVGELIEHPKFGRGTVTSLMASRIDVEFDDGNHTLAHVAPKK